MTSPRGLAFDAILMTAGRIGFVALWFVGVALVYRGLGRDAEGVAQAGLFAVCIAVIKVVSACLTDPVDLALMRRVPVLLTSDPEQAFRLLRAAVGLRVVFGLMAAGTLWWFADDFARWLFHRDDAGSLPGLVAVAILADMAFRATLIVLQASQRFVAFVAFEGSLHSMRLAAVVVLWATGTMTVEWAVGSYAAASVLAACGGCLLLPRGLLSRVRTGWSEARELLASIKWMLPGMMVAALNERFDLFLVGAWSGPEATGLYGAVLTLALVPDLVAGCLTSLMQPRIVRLLQDGRFGAVLRIFLMVGVPVCALGLLVAVPLAAPVIGLVLGPAYLAGVPAFLWVLAGTLFWLAVTPLPLTLIAVTAPSGMILLTLLQSALLLLLGMLLLPAFGIVGMAQAVCAARVAVALAALIAATRLAAAASSHATAAPLPRRAA
jgi:O-antigen/teichoic acid export membrane protein